MGSASETEYQLLLAHDLKYLNNDDYKRLQNGIVEIKRMLTSLLKTLRATYTKLKAESLMLNAVNSNLIANCKLLA